MTRNTADEAPGPAERAVAIAPADWDGFGAVMGEKGGCGGCWCMLWRLPKRVMEAQMGERNRAAMRALFDADAAPGLVARVDGAPAGWVQVAPRAAFPRLAAARVLKPVDDLPVWSVACLLVRPPFRRAGLSVALLRAACAFAAARGAPALEGYPVAPARPDYPPVYAWTGFAGAFRAAGFAEVARRSPTRPIMRRALA